MTDSDFDFFVVYLGSPNNKVFVGKKQATILAKEIASKVKRENHRDGIQLRCQRGVIVTCNFMLCLRDLLGEDVTVSGGSSKNLDEYLRYLQVCRRVEHQNMMAEMSVTPAAKRRKWFTKFFTVQGVMLWIAAVVFALFYMAINGAAYLGNTPWGLL